MDNGCPECEKLSKKHISTLHPAEICLSCQLNEAIAASNQALTRARDILIKMEQEREQERKRTCEVLTSTGKQDTSRKVM